MHMANLTSRLILSLVDRVSAPARKAAQSIRGVVSAVTEGNGQKLRAMAEANRQAIRQLSGDFLGAAGTAAAFGYALSRPIASAQAFQSVLTDIGQKADMSRTQQLRLGKAIRALGPMVNQTSADIAGGVDTLAGFGLDPQKSLAMMRPIGMAATAYKAQIQDLARASFAAVDNLKVPFDQTGQALGIMAVAGKEGAFEIADMAQYFPELTAAAQALGQQGAPAVADLAAALEVARKGAADGAEAATNLQNILQKMHAPATNKAFAKMGVDLEGSLKAAMSKGMTPLEAITEVTQRTLKGDLSKLAYLFEDAQVQKGLRPLIQNLDEYRRIRKAAANAGPVIDKDFADRMKDSAEQSRAFKIQTENLSVSFGTALMPGVNAFLGAITPLVTGLTKLTERYPGLTRVIVGTTAGLVALRLATVSFKFGKAQMLAGLLDLGAGLSGFRTAVAGAMVAAKKKLAGGLMAMVIETRTIGGLLSLTLKGILAGTGIGLLVLAAGWIITHWKSVTTFFQGFCQGFVAAIAPVRPALEPMIKGVKAVVGWVKKLIGNGGDDWTNWGVKAGTAVGKFVVGAIKWVDDLFDRFKKVLTIAGKIADWAPRAVGMEVAYTAARGRAALAGKTPPGRARGGHVAAGGLYQINEDGIEIFRPGRSGTMLPHREVERLGSGSRHTGGGAVFAPRIQINGAGASAEQVAEMVMARMRAEYRRFTDGGHSDSAGVFA